MLFRPLGLYCGRANSPHHLAMENFQCADSHKSNGFEVQLEKASEQSHFT